MKTDIFTGFMARPRGFEPLTYRFVAGHSIRGAKGAFFIAVNSIPQFKRFVKGFWKIFYFLAAS